MKKLQLLLLVGRCLVVALARGKAKRVPAQPKKICIIQRAKLGDMVCTTPLFNAIKKQYPAAAVWVVGDALNKELLAGHPSVDGYIVWPRAILSIENELRAQHFDALCITATSAEAVVSAFLAGVPCIVAPKIAGGWSPYETKLYSLVRSLVFTAPHTMGQYAPREYLRLLSPLGIHTTDTKKTLIYSPQAAQKAEVYLHSIRWDTKLLVGIAPGAGNKIKEWPPERFAAVADHIAATYSATVVVFGSSRDEEEVAAMMRAVTNKDRVHNALGVFAIDELKAAVSKLSLFISGDTGPIYIAEAFGVPTIDIVGPMDEREQPPQGERHYVLVPPRKTPQLHIMNASVYDAAEARRQAEAVRVEDVMATIAKALT